MINAQMCTQLVASVARIFWYIASGARLRCDIQQCMQNKSKEQRKNASFPQNRHKCTEPVATAQKQISQQSGRRHKAGGVIEFARRNKFSRTPTIECRSRRQNFFLCPASSLIVSNKGPSPRRRASPQMIDLIASRYIMRRPSREIHLDH
jgi:hypothetical protein